jgi:hypothetical protein
LWGIHAWDIDTDQRDEAALGKPAAIFGVNVGGGAVDWQTPPFLWVMAIIAGLPVLVLAVEALRPA